MNQATPDVFIEHQNRIVVVDDDVDDHLILRDYFNEIGVPEKTVGFFHHGQKIIDYLAAIEDSKLPGLIVLDLNMPILNGTQTLQHLKQEARIKNIPIIIYSTSDNEYEKNKCLGYGAVEYLVKPMTYEEGKSMAEKFASYI